MNRQHIIWSLTIAIIICVIILVILTSNSYESMSNEFHDFTVVEKPLKSLPPSEQKKIASELKNQLRMITSNTKISDKMKSFFKKIPIIFTKDETNFKGNHGLFLTRNPQEYPMGYIELDAKSGTLDHSKPILLHEMIHAFDYNYYHFENPDIIQFYNDAKTNDLYPQYSDTDFLSNAREYFAIACTLYLVDSIEQAPFTARPIQNKQVEMWAFMKKLFSLEE